MKVWNSTLSNLNYALSLFSLFATKSYLKNTSQSGREVEEVTNETDYTNKRENVESKDFFQLCELTVMELKYNLFCPVHSLEGTGLLLEEHFLYIHMMWWITGKTNMRDEHCSRNTRPSAFGITRHFSEALTGEVERMKGKGTKQA